MIKADLTGKTILVTGASSGFGAHFSEILAASGGHVIAAARREDRLVSLVERIRAVGGRADALKLDVADDKAVAAAFERMPDLDVVVNNAGVANHKNTMTTTAEEWRGVYDVNVHGLWYVSKAAIDAARRADRPLSIINIASITGLRTGSGIANYASSKAAVLHLTKSLALDCARYKVRVNAIAPGYFRTDINEDFLDSEFGRSMIKRIPARRLGNVADLDGPLLLLASDASSYMSGSVIEVDGGHLCSTL